MCFYKGTKEDSYRIFKSLEPYAFTKEQKSSNLYTEIAKNRNYIITGCVAALPLTGKYCMEKRGVAVSEPSTVRKKPEYHAGFVI